jgi:hypothetical protein
VYRGDPLPAARDGCVEEGTTQSGGGRRSRRTSGVSRETSVGPVGACRARLVLGLRSSTRWSVQALDQVGGGAVASSGPAPSTDGVSRSPRRRLVRLKESIGSVHAGLPLRHMKIWHARPASTGCPGVRCSPRTDDRQQCGDRQGSGVHGVAGCRLSVIWMGRWSPHDAGGDLIRLARGSVPPALPIVVAAGRGTNAY